MSYKFNVISGRFDIDTVATSVASIGGYWGTGTELSPDEGDWHIVIDGTNLSVQRYETGAWVEKGIFLS